MALGATHECLSLVSYIETPTQSPNHKARFLGRKAGICELLRRLAKCCLKNKAGSPCPPSSASFAFMHCRITYVLALLWGAAHGRDGRLIVSLERKRSMAEIPELKRGNGTQPELVYFSTKAEALYVLRHPHSSLWRKVESMRERLSGLFRPIHNGLPRLLSQT